MIRTSNYLNSSNIKEEFVWLVDANSRSAPVCSGPDMGPKADAQAVWRFAFFSRARKSMSHLSVHCLSRLKSIAAVLQPGLILLPIVLHADVSQISSEARTGDTCKTAHVLTLQLRCLDTDAFWHRFQVQTHSSELSCLGWIWSYFSVQPFHVEVNQPSM